MEKINRTQQQNNQADSELAQYTGIHPLSTEPASGSKTGTEGQKDENRDKPKNHYKYEDIICVVLIAAVAVFGLFVALGSFRERNYDQGIAYLCLYALMSLLPWNLIRNISFKRIVFFFTAALHFILISHYLRDGSFYEEEMIPLICGLTALCYLIFYRHYIIKPLKKNKDERKFK